jgi:hypothetical protein
MRQRCTAIGLCKGVFRHNTYSWYSLFRFFSLSDENSVTDSSASDENSVTDSSASDEHSVTDSSASDDSSLGESTHDVSALEMLQTPDRAATLIQKQFRKSFPRKSSSSSSLIVEPWSATTVALSAFEAQPDVTETTDHEDDGDFIGYSEEKEVAKEEKRSGKALWEIAVIAGKFIGATMISGMTFGSPVDEDDAIAVVALTKGSTGGGGGGAGVGGTEGAGAGVTGGTWGRRYRWNGGGHVGTVSGRRVVFS